MHRMTPFFSIVVPVYDVAPYLRDCLDSLLAQSFTDWEAVCVDDGSTDGSGAILDEYASRDTRIRVIHQGNAGVGAARNVALKAVQGNYLTFLDGDDMYCREWLAEAFSVISNTGVDLLHMGFTSFSDKPPEGELSRKYTVYDGVDAVREWGYPEFAEHGQCCICFMKGSALLRNGLNEFPPGMKFMEDNFFMIRNAAAFEKAAQSEFAGYYYRVRTGSATCSTMKLELFSRLFQEYRRLVDDLGFGIVPRTNRIVQTGIAAWTNNGERKAKGADRQMADMVRQMAKDGYFDLSLVSPKWRLGHECVVRLRSFFMMDVLYVLMHAWARIRAVFIARPGH